MRTVVTPSEQLQRALEAVGLDVQASLALSRATLRAIAGLSPAMAATVSAAIDDELDHVAAVEAPRAVSDALEDARPGRLSEAADPAARSLEEALIQAAAAVAPAPCLARHEAVPNAVQAR